MSPQVPDPDYDEPKEVYAFYGLAMYSAQLLEHSMLNLAAGLFMTKAPLITRSLFDSTFEDLDRKTLGELLKAARKLLTIPPGTDAIFSAALVKRNYLAHRFFRVHAEIFPHEKGRRLMLDELSGLIREFQSADEHATPLYMAVWKHFGIDEQWIEREIAEMREEVRGRLDAI